MTSANKESSVMLLKPADAVGFFIVMTYVFLAVWYLWVNVIAVDTVDGSSMYPTLNSGQHVIIIKHSSYHIGDIVIVDRQRELGVNAVKRIVAVGGQRVCFDYAKNAIYIDGERKFESYVYKSHMLPVIAELSYPFVVPNDCIFVCGDNRDNSIDSRCKYFGTVNKNSVIGKVVKVI